MTDTPPPLSADPAAMTVVADADQARLHGFRPGYQFVTFDLHKPR